MSKTKKTFKELDQFDKVATGYLVRNGFYSHEQRGYTDKPATKLVSAIKNVFKQVFKNRDEILNEELELARINNALEDPTTKELLLNEDRSYKYSKEGMVKLRADLNVIYNREVDMHQRIVKDADLSELTEEEIEAFDGLVIDSAPLPEFE